MSGKRKASGKQLTMEFVVGLVFIAAMAILGFFTIILGGGAMGFGKATFQREVDFSQVGGMRVGDKVLLRGVQIGQISDLYIPEGTFDNVRAKLTLKQDFLFREGYLIEIRNSSVLGGNFLYVELGDTEKDAIPQDAILQGKTPIDVFAEAGKLVGKLNKSMKDITNFTQGLKKKDSTLGLVMNDRKLYDDAVKAFGALSDAGKKIGNAVDEVKGVVTVAKKTLDTYDKTGKKIGTAFDSVRVAATDVSTASNEVKGAIADARKGKGTLGKILTDDKFYTDLQQAAASVRDVAKKATDKKSSIGKLMNDEGAMYASIKKAFDETGSTMKNANEVVTKVNSGVGTIGKLVNDETVWRDLKQTIKDVQGAVDDFREQSPILTFGSFIMGSL